MVPSIQDGAAPTDGVVMATDMGDAPASSSLDHANPIAAMGLGIRQEGVAGSDARHPIPARRMDPEAGVYPVPVPTVRIPGVGLQIRA